MRRVASLLALAACGDPNLTITNEAPTARITSHGDGDPIRAELEVTLEGAVADVDDDANDLLVAWLVDGRIACPASTPDDDGATRCALTLANDATTITLRVEDPWPEVAEASVSPSVIAAVTPTVRLDEPTADGSWWADAPTPLLAVVDDVDDPRESLVLTWKSSLDGPLAGPAHADPSGEALGEVTLTEGVHAITVTATDATGRSASDEVAITVGPPNTVPLCQITAPTAGLVNPEGAILTLVGRVKDDEQPVETLSVTVTSDVDGILGTPTPASDGMVTLHTDALSVGEHHLSLTAEDVRGATCTVERVVRVAAPPTVTWIDPQAGTWPAGPLTLTVVAEDPDGAADALAVSWISSTDGDLGDATPDATGEASLVTGPLRDGQHLLTVTVVDPDGLSATADRAVVMDGRPGAPTVAILPDPADTTDPLTLAVLGASVDPEGDPVDYDIAWTRDGQPVTGLADPARVESSRTAKGETWEATVTPWDAWGPGASATATLTLVNAPPTVAGVVLSPGGLGFLCTGAADDPDGDPVDLVATWWIDGVVQPWTTASVDGSAFESGDVVLCGLTPDDGEDQGERQVSDPMVLP